MIKKILLIGILINVIACFYSCEKENLLDWRSENCVSFQKPTSFLSFLGYREVDRPKDTLSVALHIGGEMVDRDRYVMAIAVEDTVHVEEVDKWTTARPDEYRLLGGVVKAGGLYGTFDIELRNSDRLDDADLKLRIQLVETEDFEVGLKENQTMDLSWTRKLVKPQTWGAMTLYFCDTYSTIVYQSIIEVTGFSEIPEGMSREELRMWGRKFGDYVRQWKIDHNGKDMVHDDGENKGLIVIPKL